MKVTFKVKDNTSKCHAKRAIEDLPIDKTHVVVIQPETRTLANNAAQWPILNAFADQLQWPVNGQMAKLDAEEWKDILTAAYKQETVKLGNSQKIISTNFHQITLKTGVSYGANFTVQNQRE